MPAPEPPEVRPDDHDVVFGTLFGDDPDASPLPDGTARQDPRPALEDAVLEGLSRPPCVVSFSGGRDSSLVLAVAARVAAREGLDPPVPVTLAFPHAGEADERSWQELVVRHLELADWERLEPSGLGFLGPVARRSLQDHGLLWPANAHFHLPVMARATGGSVLTGIDGDGLLAGWRWGPEALARTGWPRALRRQAAEEVQHRAPRAVADRLAHRTLWRPRWVRAEAWPALASEVGRRGRPEPVRWDHRVARWWASRSVGAARTAYAVLGASCDVQVVHPLLDPHFVGAVALHGGRRGLGSRTAAMELLGADLLPRDVIGRGTKAFFDEVLWDAPTRDLLERWDGAGVDRHLVDEAALRAEWRRPHPHFGSALLAQQAWLAGSRPSPSPQGPHQPSAPQPASSAPGAAGADPSPRNSGMVTWSP